MDLRADPVHGEADEPDAHGRIEALDRLHQADVSFLDQVADRQAIAHVAARDVHDEAQVREHEVARRVEVLVFVESTGEGEFLLAAEHRNRRYALDISLEASERAGQDERRVGECESLA